MVVHRFPFGQIVGHHSPLDTASQNVPNPVDNFSSGNGFAEGALANRRQKWFNEFPLGIREVAGIERTIHQDSLANLLSHRLQTASKLWRKSDEWCP